MKLIKQGIFMVEISKPFTREEAMQHAIDCTKCRDEEATRKDLDNYSQALEQLERTGSEFHGDSIVALKSEISKLENWLESDALKSGNYPIGIDRLMTELIEWRSVVYAIDETDFNDGLFNKSAFFAQWAVGAVYAINAIIGKMVNQNSQDNSLRKLWNKVYIFIKRDGFADKSEINALTTNFNGERFKNDGSKVILYRNTSIAHNEKNTQPKWSDVDEDLRILTRAWALITSWCSYGLFNSLRCNEVAFMGLEKHFTPEQMNQLYLKRLEYLGRIRAWGMHPIGHNLNPDDIKPLDLNKTYSLFGGNGPTITTHLV
ncbi:hypothetical protein [Chromobacterium amazonense]|uniref:hypothetical protein n=1 Tax=Chromobacterium amazonense TaxID=1382803 RepID=UPI0031F71A73